MGMMGKTKAGDGHTFGFYRSEPAGTVRGGLVIVQEIFGVNSHIRAVCDQYAGDGFVTVAPALFDRTERDIELGYDGDSVARGRAIREKVSLEDALADVEAAAGELAGTRRIGLVGYCWGGTIAWAAATRSKTFAATVGYYGGGIADMKAEQPNCPVMLHFGEQDHAIPLEGVRAVQAAHPKVPVFIYPAGHGFNCDQRGSYHEDSARLARERTLAFLAEHVG
jgi:carboxymethylenebutenolidase